MSQQIKANQNDTKVIGEKNHVTANQTSIPLSSLPSSPSSASLSTSSSTSSLSSIHRNDENLQNKLSKSGMKKQGEKKNETPLCDFIVTPTYKHRFSSHVSNDYTHRRKNYHDPKYGYEYVSIIPKEITSFKHPRTFDFASIVYNKPSIKQQHEAVVGEKSTDQRTVNTRSLRKKRDYFIPFHALHVFSEDDAPNDIPHDVLKSKEYHDLKQSFQRRYIWTRKSYLQHIDVQPRTPPDTARSTDDAIDTTEELIGRCFNYLSYSFTGGPYRNVWIKWGIDPRQYNESYGIDKRELMKWQSIDFRIPTEYMKHIDQAYHIDSHDTAANSQRRTYDTLFKHIPTQAQTLYQLCDIDIPEVQEILNTVTLNDTCNMKSGWVEERVLTHIRSIMKQRVEGWMCELNIDVDLLKAQMRSSDSKSDIQEFVKPSAPVAKSKSTIRKRSTLSPCTSTQSITTSLEAVPSASMPSLEEARTPGKTKKDKSAARISKTQQRQELKKQRAAERSAKKALAEAAKKRRKEQRERLIQERKEEVAAEMEEEERELMAMASSLPQISLSRQEMSQVDAAVSYLLGQGKVNAAGQGHEEEEE